MKKITLSENKKKIVIEYDETRVEVTHFRPEEKFASLKDTKGNNPRKCDFIVSISSKQKTKVLLIELKGNHVSHAISQLESVLKNHEFREAFGEYNKCCLIVANNIPKVQVKTHNEQNKFMKNYSASLIFASGQRCQLQASSVLDCSCRCN